MLAIVSPMATELSGIRRAVREPESRGLCFYVTGIGKAATITGFVPIAQGRPRAVIMAGFCGAVDPHLRTGDLHVAASFRHGENNSIPADAELSSAMFASARSQGVKVSDAPSITVGSIAGPAAKAELRRSTGIASVNMEDYWAASAAAAAGVPFASVRAVLDTADQSLPEYLTAKDTRPARVVVNAVIRPVRMPTLLKLAMQSRSACRNLTRCVLDTIDALAGSQAVPREAPR